MKNYSDMREMQMGLLIPIIASIQKGWCPIKTRKHIDYVIYVTGLLALEYYEMSNKHPSPIEYGH